MAALPHVLVLGGTGFVGRHLIARLAGAGHRVTVIARRRANARHLILLPTVQVVEADPFDAAALAARVRDAETVVNLVGILHESGQETFAGIHVEGTRKVVNACKSGGVARLLQMSAINAAPDAPSRYLRSKGDAENLVADSGLAWTIFRPSVIFGREDSFLNRFASLSRNFPLIPLGAADARFAPIYVTDVVRCFERALADDGTIGQRYNLCGPEVYTLKALFEYVGATIGRPRPIVALGPALASLQARVFEALPGRLLSRDNLASMQKDAVCDGPFPPVFGFPPTPLETVAPSWLAPAAVRSRFDPLRSQVRH